MLKRVCFKVGGWTVLGWANGNADRLNVVHTCFILDGNQSTRDEPYFEFLMVVEREREFLTCLIRFSTLKVGRAFGWLIFLILAIPSFFYDSQFWRMKVSQ